MNSDIFNLLLNSSVLVTIGVGGCILLLMYITYTLRQDNEDVEKVKSKNNKLICYQLYLKTRNM